MLRAYIETTVPSYLTAWPSGDLVRAAHQKITQDWWSAASQRFELFVSEAVVEEIALGDPTAAEARAAAVRGIRILNIDDDVVLLAQQLSEQLPLPPTATVDAVHIACATIYKMDYLVTWNCRHIANPHVVRKLIRINDQNGRSTPLIVTPENLLQNLLEQP